MATKIKNEQLETQLKYMGISEHSLTYFRDPDFISFCMKRILNPLYQQANNHADQEEFYKSFLKLVSSPALIPYKISIINLPHQGNPNELLFLKLISYYNTNVIPSDKLIWISQTDVRQTAFLHAATKYIHLNPTLIGLSQHTIAGILFNFNSLTISPISFSIPFIAPSLNNPYQNRKLFIDFLNFIDADLQTKLASIEYIKLQWETLFKNNTSPKWTEKEGNKQLYSWLRGNSEITNNPLFGWVLNDVNYTDKDAIITFFDLLYAQNLSLGELTLKKVKNAWTQVKFREKNRDRIQFNFLMDSRFKNELKEMSRHLRKPQSQLVEEAIDKMLIEYKKQR